MDDLPKTPAGKMLDKLLLRLSEPEGITIDHVSEVFHPSFIRALGSSDAVAGILKAWGNQFSPFRLDIVEDQSGPHAVVAEVTSPAGQIVVLTCTVDEGEPHLIRGLLSRPKPYDVATLDEVDDLIRYHGAVGLGAAVIEDSEISWARSWGPADASTSEPISENTLLQCGSISKPVAAFGALRLVDQGIVDLDTDLNEILTSWKVPPVNGWQPVITLRNLITHTAGLTVWGFPGYQPGTEIPSLIEVLDGRGNTEAIQNEALPGLMWRYSGGGYCVLQQVMIDVSGNSFSDLMKELVLDPLGMNDSTYEQPLPQNLHDRAATGHSAGKPIEGRWPIHPELAAAGLWTTPSDLGRFLIGVANAYAGQTGSVLEKGLATQMLTGHDAAPAMGLGLALGGAGEVRTFGHGGSNAGFIGNIVSTFDGSLALVALSNSNEGGAAINDLFRFLANDRHLPELIAQSSMGQEAQEGMMRVVPIEHTDPIEISEEQIDAIVGKYETNNSLTLEIQRGDGVSVRLDGQNPFALYPHSAGDWVSKAIDVRVEFDNGRLRLHQLGRIVEAKRRS